jgi:hypothetical protein
MKKTIIALLVLISMGSAVEARNIIQKTYHTCGGTPHAGGPNTYNVVNPWQDQVRTTQNGDRITHKQITCEDDGPKQCVINWMVIPAVDFPDAFPYVQQKIANGILVGEFNPNGTPSDGDPYNQDLNANPYFSWQATSPTCSTIDVYYEEN